MIESNYLRGKTFSVITLGCRVNHYEAEAIASALENRGASLVTRERGGVDIVVAVTCSVTSTADSKARKILRRARRENPKALIVACGCWAQGVSGEDARSAGADIVLGNRVKDAIAGEIERWYESPGEARSKKIDVAACAAWEGLSLDRPRMGTRAFIKVQDGCDRSCSYCIVPALRGASVSRELAETIGEVAAIAEDGASEIVLTGVQLSGYNCDGVSLAGLLSAVSRVPGVRRLRLGSLEPFAVTEELLEAMRDSEAFCPHLHLPLQSGDADVLRAMRRGYSPSGFAGAVEMARKYLGDDVHISTDLIVGFPGESDTAFQNSLALIESLALGKTHVFPYSPRDGTSGAAMERLPSPVVNERARRALAAAERLLSEYAAKMTGKSDSVLVENVCRGTASGWGRRYLRIYLKPSHTEKDLTGNEFIVSPKTSFGSILLCEGVGREDIAIYTDE